MGCYVIITKTTVIPEPLVRYSQNVYCECILVRIHIYFFRFLIWPTFACLVCRIVQKVLIVQNGAIFWLKSADTDNTEWLPDLPRYFLHNSSYVNLLYLHLQLNLATPYHAIAKRALCHWHYFYYCSLMKIVK